MIGGGLAGQALYPNTGAQNEDDDRHAHYRRRNADDDEFYPSDSDEEVYRGLDRGTIEGNTVGHVYAAPSAAQAAAARPGATASSTDEDKKCMVCMEAFANGDELRTLPCLHRYHRSCIDEWLSRSRECPICKRDITDTAPAPGAMQDRPRSS